MSADVLGPEWNLSPTGLEIISENGVIKDRGQLIRRALDTDLKEIGKTVLTTELTKNQTTKLVLQIQKIRNVSAPKANEESQAAPRMLKLILTDGDTTVQALELSSIQQISRERTAPGSKVLINGAKIISGYLLLTPSCCSLLGGKVPHLYEKWELAKSVQHNNRQSGNTDGPPPWVNFGCKIQTAGKDDNFKSLENKSKDPTKESTEFEQQRQGAIAEATSGAIKKVFGGRAKQQVQPVQNNNKRSNENKGRSGKGKTLGPKEIDAAPQKPLEKVSLFDFLETKLPVNEPPQKVAETPVEKFVPPTQSFQQNKPNYQKNKTNNEKYDSNKYNSKPNNNRGQHYNNYNNSSSQIEYPQPKTNNSRREPVNTKYYNSQTNSQRVEPTTSNSNNYKKEPYQHNANSNTSDKSVNDITQNMSRISLGNNSFASKIIRQQLNIDPTSKKQESAKENVISSENGTVFPIGSECLAKYWEDGKYYNATVTAVTERTYVVKFKGYDNIEEVLKKDCQPLGTKNNRKYDNNRSYSGGTMKFTGRRGYNKN